MNTCEDDKKDENWDAIINSSECTSEQKGEAHLARGGFSFFDLATSGDFDPISALGLTQSNWTVKLKDFEEAAVVVKGTYQTGNSIQKSIFCFGIFLSMYTQLIGILDNGADGSSDAFDGNIEPAEMTSFIGTGVVDSSGDDGTDLETTNYFQFKYQDVFYIIDITTIGPSPDVSIDLMADGNPDTKIVVPDLSDPGRAAFNDLINPNNWTALNQIVRLNSLSDPLTNSGAINVTEVLYFTTFMFDHLKDLENAILALGFDASDDKIQEMSSFKNKIDNGGQCQLLNDNPALRLVQIFADPSKSQEVSTDDYSTKNVFTILELVSLGEDASFDTSLGFPNPGVKLLYKRGINDYIPYWRDATDDVKLGMESLSLLDPIQAKQNDGKVTLSEIICASELLSE